MDIGDIVVCVDASPSSRGWSLPFGVGSKHMVTAVARPGDRWNGLVCREPSLQVASFQRWMLASRFRKIEPGDLVEEPRRETAPRELELA